MEGKRKAILTYLLYRYNPFQHVEVVRENFIGNFINIINTKEHFQ